MPKHPRQPVEAPHLADRPAFVQPCTVLQPPYIRDRPAVDRQTRSRQIRAVKLWVDRAWLLIRSIFEKAFEIRPTLDYGPRLLLQAGLRPFKGRGFYCQASHLRRRNLIDSVPEFRMRLQNLVDLVSKARVPFSQLVVRHARFLVQHWALWRRPDPSFAAQPAAF